MGINDFLHHAAPKIFAAFLPAPPAEKNQQQNSRRRAPGWDPKGDPRKKRKNVSGARLDQQPHLVADLNLSAFPMIIPPPSPRIGLGNVSRTALGITFP